MPFIRVIESYIILGICTTGFTVFSVYMFYEPKPLWAYFFLMVPGFFNVIALLNCLEHVKEYYNLDTLTHAFKYLLCSALPRKFSDKY